MNESIEQLKDENRRLRVQLKDYENAQRNITNLRSEITRLAKSLGDSNRNNRVLAKLVKTIFESGPDGYDRCREALQNSVMGECEPCVRKAECSIGACHMFVQWRKTIEAEKRGA